MNKMSNAMDSPSSHLLIFFESKLILSKTSQAQLCGSVARVSSLDFVL